MNWKNHYTEAAKWVMLTMVASCIPLAGCQAQTVPPDVFDHAKATAIAPKRQAQMDVAFFNDFVVRDMPGGMWQSGGRHPRGDRIHKLAEEGFEVAWLAERLYDFHRFGFHNTPHAGGYWNRIKELADGGDASAQCFIWLAAEELQVDSFFKPPKADVDNRAHYLQLAVAQGQAECTGSWGAYPDENLRKHAENNLYAAKKGCARCQSRLRGFYQRGDGLPKDLAKAWCWALETVQNSDSLMYETDRRLLHSDIIQLKPDHSGRPEDLTQYRPGTHCTEQITASTSTIEPKKGE